MKSIHLLDSDTINKIAAGEVVERPSSVIKELVENAIDAKASAITIEIKEGGIAMMRVTDNGGGIDRDDIKTAFVRHATSIRSCTTGLPFQSVVYTIPGAPSAFQPSFIAVV